MCATLLHTGSLYTAQWMVLVFRGVSVGRLLLPIAMNSYGYTGSGFNLTYQFRHSNTEMKYLLVVCWHHIMEQMEDVSH